MIFGGNMEEKDIINQPAAETTPNNSDVQFDIMAFYNEIDVIEDASNEKLREANKKLPSWSLVPPVGYKK